MTQWHNPTVKESASVTPLYPRPQFPLFLKDPTFTDGEPVPQTMPWAWGEPLIHAVWRHDLPVFENELQLFAVMDQRAYLNRMLRLG